MTIDKDKILSIAIPTELLIERREAFIKSNYDDDLDSQVTGFEKGWKDGYSYGHERAKWILANINKDKK